MPLIRKPPPHGPASATAPTADPGAALRGGDADLRRQAARALADAPDNAGLLAQALAGEADARVREALLSGLARIATPAAVAGVVAQLRSDDAERRAAALDALRAMPAAARTVLPALLVDEDADVRGLACELARGLPAGEAGALLEATLREDPEANVCATAIDVLAEVGAPGAVDALRTCRDRFAEDPFIAFAVAVALARIAAETGADDA